MHCAKEGHKLECFKENRNVFVEIDRGESLITADIPCKYGAEYESVMCRGKAMIIEDRKENVRNKIVNAKRRRKKLCAEN